MRVTVVSYTIRESFCEGRLLQISMNLDLPDFA